MSLIQSPICAAKHSSCKRTFYFVHMWLCTSRIKFFCVLCFPQIASGRDRTLYSCLWDHFNFFPWWDSGLFSQLGMLLLFSFTGAALSTQISLDLFGLRLWTRAKCVYKLSRILHKILQKVHKNKNTLSSFFFIIIFKQIKSEEIKSINQVKDGAPILWKQIT